MNAHRGRHLMGTDYRAFFPVLIAVLCEASHAAAQASFQGLGDLPGGTFLSEVSGISGDGSTIVGWSNSSESSPGWNQAFKWSDGKLIGLPDLPGGLMCSNAGTASFDGSIVVGDAADEFGSQAAVWLANGNVLNLGSLDPSQPMGTARGISDNGLTVVGSCTSTSGWQAFRWTQAGGLVGMGDLSGGGFNSAAQTITNGATIIFGTGTSAAGANAFRWTPGGGMVGLGDLPGGGFFSEPFAATPEGTVMVGRGKSTASGANRFEAMMWTESGGLVGLGDFAGGVFESFAMDITDDGQTVVGLGTTAEGQRAMVWTPLNGMQLLSQVITESGVSLTGWTLTAAMAVSADGRRIAGNGVNPGGQTEAWVFTLPPPVPAASTWGLVVLFLALLVSAACLARRTSLSSGTP